MAGDNVVELSDATFDAEVLKATIPVLVDFTATWCQPCKALAPVVQAIADESSGLYKVAKADIDDCPEVAKRYAVHGVPTVMVFKNGEKRGKVIGFSDKEALLKLLQQVERCE